MKKFKLLFCVGAFALMLAACGDGGKESGSVENSTEEGSGESSVQESDSAENSSASVEEGEPESVPGDAGVNPAEGWSEEMEGLKAAVVEAVGADEYWPDMPMDPEMLEMFYGLTADLYEDYMAESPMISANVDALVIVRAKEDKVEEVEKALTTYREANVNDTMQYPQNLGKIQASRVEKIGNYVIFVQLGGNAISSEKEEDVLAQCREANEKAIEAIRNSVE